MKTRSLCVLLSVSFSTVALASDASSPERPCKEHPAVVGPCFGVRGRLSLWNGTPTARLWVVGTRRVLGISDSRRVPGYEQMPRDVGALLTWNANIYADYEFCPFTLAIPGVMQLGCIQSAKRIRVEKRGR